VNNKCILDLDAFAQHSEQIVLQELDSPLLPMEYVFGLARRFCGRTLAEHKHWTGQAKSRATSLVNKGKSDEQNICSDSWNLAWRLGMATSR